MRGRYAKHAQQNNRRAWEEVTLNKVKDTPTLQEWLCYRADFEDKRSRVDGWTEQENFRMVVQQLPNWMKQKVAQEQQKRKGKRKHLRVGIDKGHIIPDIKQELEEMWSRPLRVVQAGEKQMVVELLTDQEVGQLLDFDRGTWGDTGIVLRVYPVEVDMDGSALFDFVEALLQT